MRDVRWSRFIPARFQGSPGGRSVAGAAVGPAAGLAVGAAVVAIVACLLVLAGPVAAQDAADRTVVPGDRVGAIRQNSTTAQLKKIYGDANVRATKVSVGEGEMADGLVIFPGQPDEIFIVWKTKDREIEYVRYYNKASAWKTAEGIGIGTTAAELTRLNGGPFSITGFGWDYGGRIVDWRRGKLSKLMILDMRATKTLSKAYEQSVLGDKIFPSNNPVMEQKMLVVRGVYIGLAE